MSKKINSKHEHVDENPLTRTHVKIVKHTGFKNSNGLKIRKPDIKRTIFRTSGGGPHPARIGSFIEGSALDSDNNSYFRPDYADYSIPYMKPPSIPELYITKNSNSYTTPYIKQDMPYRDTYSYPLRKYRSKMGTSNTNHGSRGFFDGLAAVFNPPKQMSNFKMDVGVTNTTQFSNSLTAMYKTIVEEITNVTSTTTSTTDQIINLNLNNTSMSGNVTVDLSIGQSIKCFSSEKLNVDVVKAATLTAATSIMDTLMTGISNMSSGDISSVQTTTTNNSLISSIFGGASSMSKDTNIGINSAIQNNIATQKNIMLNNIMENINTVSITGEIKTKLIQMVNTTSENTTVSGNIDFKLKINQTTDIMQIIVRNINLASQIFSSISANTVFKTDASVKTALDNSISAADTQTTTNETVSSVFSSLLAPLTSLGYGAMAAAGVCGLAVVYYFFNTAETHVHMNSPQNADIEGHHNVDFTPNNVHEAQGAQFTSHKLNDISNVNTGGGAQKAGILKKRVTFGEGDLLHNFSTL